KPAHLTVIKQLVPANDPGTFDLKIDGVAKASGVGNNGTTGGVVVAIGSHTVSEAGANGTSLGDYTSVISGDCDGDGSVTLNPGESKTCTITTTLKPSHLTVIKQLLPANDSGKFDLKVDGVAKASAVGDGGTTGSVEVSAGQHTVSETGAN